MTNRTRATPSQTVTTTGPKENEIRTQLNQILNCNEFARSPKISRFLDFLVEETLKGGQEYIKESSIANIVFEKDHTFDPQTDPLVRVNAVRLRRMLQNYYSTKGLDDKIIIDLVKGSYVPKFYYQKKQEKQEAIDQEVITNYSFPSVAVLNLKNTSGSKEYNYLADGITHEIIDQLSKIKEIVVVARFAINSKEDVYANTQKLRQSIDVRYILSGTVMIVDETIKVFIELDDALMYANIWTKTFEKKLGVKNIISIQQSIASQVAISIAQPYGVILRIELAKLHRTPTESISAYQQYLYFYQWVLTLSAADHLKARESLEHVVTIDPAFSDAWAALALIYNAEYLFAFNPVARDRDVRDLAYDAAKTALRADPENARAHYSLVFARMAKVGTRACLEDAEKAYQLNTTNSLLLAIHAFRLALCGEDSRSLELAEQAIVYDNSHPDFYYFPFIINYYRHGNYSAALYESKNINMPEFFWSHMLLTAVCSQAGDLENAKVHVKKLIELYPRFERFARVELEKWDMSPELIMKFLEGFSKAGLNV